MKCFFFFLTDDETFVALQVEGKIVSWYMIHGLKEWSQRLWWRQNMYEALCGYKCVYNCDSYWQPQPILFQNNNKYYFKIYGRDSCYVKKRRFDRLRRSVYFYGTQYYNTRQCNLNFFCVAHIREKWKQRLQWRSLPRYICRLSCFWAVSGCK